MYYHVHIFNIMEFKDIRSVWNGRANENGIAILQWPTYGSSRLLQICLHFLIYYKYCVLKNGTMYFHVHIFLAWSFKASGQFEMAGQMGMDGPFYNDRPMILQDYYKYYHLLVYNKYFVVRYVAMYYHVHIFITRQFKTSSQFGIADQMGMEEPFYNDRLWFFHCIQIWHNFLV